MKKGWIIVAIVVVLLVVYGMTVYNRLVSLNEGVNTQWAQVETQYQRRFDLIPNLVNSVKGLMKQEQVVFTAIADARTHYAGAKTVDDKTTAANEVETSLGRLLVVMENYPEIRSTETVNTLMSQLEGIENRVSVERGRFNTIVNTYNLGVKRFPSSIFASIFGFKAHPYFEAANGAAVAPTVNL